MLKELKRLRTLYEACKNRYQYTIMQIHRSKEELGNGCTSYMYMLGDEEGRLRGVQEEKAKLRDLKFCARVEGQDLKELKQKIKEQQRKFDQNK